MHPFLKKPDAGCPLAGFRYIAPLFRLTEDLRVSAGNRVCYTGERKKPERAVRFPFCKDAASAQNNQQGGPMFNPIKAAEAVKDELIQNPKLLQEWNEKANTDPGAVRKAIIEMAAKHNIKMSEGELKFTLKAAKPFLSKLNESTRKEAEELFSKMV